MAHGKANYARHNDEGERNRSEELNGIKIIAVDHGYGNMKTASTVTPTGVTASKSEPIFPGNVLEYNGMYYYIGGSRKEFLPDKTTDEDYYVLTLMAVARELNVAGIREATVHLAAGLPLTWICRQREDFRAYLMQNEKVRYRFNGKDYHIRFAGCTLYPQGYPAIVDQLDSFKGVNILADIGNGTMNIMYINNKKPMENKCWTEKQGMNQCVIAARNAVMDTFGLKIEDEIIEAVLRFGTAAVKQEYLRCIQSVARRYVADIFATLRRYEYNPDLMKLTIVGGGGCLVSNFGEYAPDSITIIEDICATAKGYEQLALMALRRKVGV